jgi:hypothetical protein
VFMQTYVGGVSCPRALVNHGVLLVGYGARGFAALRLGDRPYWVIKNSWGSSGGSRGATASAGRGMCGVDTMVSGVAVEPCRPPRFAGRPTCVSMAELPVSYLSRARLNKHLLKKIRIIRCPISSLPTLPSATVPPFDQRPLHARALIQSSSHPAQM